jgi:ABC-2 type transport system permease protein
VTGGATYLRYELRRTLRNRRFYIFSFGFPLVLYYLIAGTNRGTRLSGTDLSFATYYMVSVSSFGTMTAMLSTGARISAERAAGWNRQLRISPLSPTAYFRTKVVTAYLVAIVSLLLLYVAGLTLGVSIPAGRWVRMTVLIALGLMPFAAAGIVIGHLVPVDSTGPVMGGLTAVLAFISGTWFPIGDHGVVHDIAQVLPSYYLVEAGRTALGGNAWGTTGWVVVVVWTVVLARVAREVYRRDTARG